MGCDYIPRHTSATINISGYIPAGKTLNASKIHACVGEIKVTAYQSFAQRTITVSVELSGTTVVLFVSGIPTGLASYMTVIELVLDFT